MRTDGQHHVLVVEDDAVSRAKLAGYMEAAGYRVSEAADGGTMRRILRRDDADLVLLDINLPREDGLDLTRELRRGSAIGIILVSARTDEVDRIIGLENGADDYVTKPFRPRELLARVKTLLRRMEGGGAERRPVKRFAGYDFDLRARRLQHEGGARIGLTRAEFELLSAFVARPGTVLHRERLLTAITSRAEAPSDRTIDVLVGRLRRKLEPDPAVPEIILTVHGEGYVLAAAIEDG